jgi:hypothetical protein
VPSPLPKCRSKQRAQTRLQAHRRVERFQPPLLTCTGRNRALRGPFRVHRRPPYSVRYSLAASDHRRALIVEDRAAAAAVNLSRRPLGQTPVSPSLSQILALRSKSNGPILFCLPKRYQPIAAGHVTDLVDP